MRDKKSNLRKSKKGVMQWLLGAQWGIVCADEIYFASEVWGNSGFAWRSDLGSRFVWFTWGIH